MEEGSSNFTHDVGWLFNDNNEPFAVYAGSDERIIKLLVASADGIVTY